MSSPEALREAVTAKKSLGAGKKIKFDKDFALRLLLAALTLAIWFLTQSMLGARTASSTSIGDGLHNLTAGLNAYFRGAPRAANALLIVSSALIDAMAIFLIAGWIFYSRLRPFLGLVILLVMRQVMQALCSLPPPPGIIWHNPGFPSLLVTYGVANDFFFSGHTAIAVFGAIELERLARTWLTGLAVAVALFEISAVVVLRAHYTMDVFAGALAAVCVAEICRKIPDHSGRMGATRSG